MYKKIMVPVDGSELAECVLSHIETIVKCGGIQSVVFVRVFEPVEVTALRGYADFSLGEQRIKEVDARGKAFVKSYLENLVSQLDYGPVSIQTEVLEGRPTECLINYARKNDVGLIIMATHGRSGVSRLVMGSVADRVMRSAKAPVLMIRPPGCEPRD